MWLDKVVKNAGGIAKCRVGQIHKTSVDKHPLGQELSWRCRHAGRQEGTTTCLAYLPVSSWHKAMSRAEQTAGSNKTPLIQPVLSQRAQEYVRQLKQPNVFAFKGELYDENQNPAGVIKLATAENSLLTTELLEYFHTHFELTPVHLKYRSFLVDGYKPSTVDILPEYFNAYFNPRVKVLPKHCVHGDGIGSLLAQIFWALCEPGDGVLMATPYYGQFVLPVSDENSRRLLADSYPRDIVYPSQAKVVVAHIPTSVDPLSEASLPCLRDALNESNNRIRVIILCNPHNPLATAYPEHMIVEYAKLAEEYNVHLLVDEVYGLEVFSSRYVPNPTPFVSILSLDVQSLAGCNPSRIHVVGGPAKDFGASGLKIGSLVSQYNPDLLRLVGRAIQALPMSSATDALFTRALGDEAFRDWFLEENRRRLSKAFEVAGDWCTFHKLSFVPASAGVFFVVDFAPLFAKIAEPNATAYEQTIAGFNTTLDAGVYIVPMTISGDPIGTRYRVTFALPPKTLLLALRRIEEAFNLAHWVPQAESSTGTAK